MVREKIPYKLVKRTVKKYVNEEISNDSVLALQDYLSEMLNNVCESLKIEFDDYNNRREVLKLPKSKRIDVSFIEILLGKLNKVSKKSNVEDIGQNNNETMFSQAGVEVA